MQAPIRILIVDDERLARVGVRQEVEKRSGVEVVGECATGEAAVRAIEELEPDLVFLDVHMPGVDGIEVVRRVGIGAMPAVVFVTAYDRYAVEAFDLHAVDYLVKPLDPERFREAFERAEQRLREGSAAELEQRLDRVLARLESEAGAARPSGSGGASPAAAGNAGGPLERLAVEEDGRTFLLDVGRIRWIESEGNYVRLHAEGGSHVVRRTMKSLERDLDGERFLRIRRSAIVNLDRLEYVERGEGEEYVFRLEGGTELTSARRYFAEVNAFLRRHR